MPLTREEKSGVVGKFQRSAQDTGSPEVQIALLSERINGLSQHFTTHKADHASRRGLLKMVNQRRKLLDYLKTRNSDSYRVLIEKQGVGKGNVTIQPMCGVCLRLVLGREEAEVADSVCECRLAHP